MPANSFALRLARASAVCFALAVLGFLVLDAQRRANPRAAEGAAPPAATATDASDATPTAAPAPADPGETPWNAGDAPRRHSPLAADPATHDRGQLYLPSSKVRLLHVDEFVFYDGEGDFSWPTEDGTDPFSEVEVPEGAYLFSSKQAPVTLPRVDSEEARDEPESGLVRESAD